jgi:hypothetical protein
LEAFDPLIHMERQSRLSALNWPRFETSLEAAAGSLMQLRKSRFHRTRDQVILRLRVYLERLFQDDNGTYPFAKLQGRVAAQEWIDNGRLWWHLKEAVARSMVHVSSKALLAGAHRAGPLWAA